MCKIGDIIVINKYIGDDGNKICKHSFVVIDDSKNEIAGLKYDLVTNVMSSFKNENHRIKKLKFKGNIEIQSEDIISNYKNNRKGYIKADQLIYFNKKNIEYYVFGRVDEKLLDKLLRVIIELQVDKKLKDNINNLVLDEKQTN